MRSFSKVSPALWQSTRFKDLPTDEARFLFLYLLTSPHQSISGLFLLPDAYAAADLGWDIERYRKVRAVVAKGSLIKVDEQTSEILIERWFLHSAPANGSHLRGIEKQIAAMQSPHLRATAMEALAQTDQAKLREARTPAEGGSQTKRPMSFTDHLNRNLKG